MSFAPTSTIIAATASGPTAPIPLSYLGVAYAPGVQVAERYDLQPVVSAFVSQGASLTYQFEVTTDQTPTPGGNWLPLSNALAGGAIQGNTPLTASCWAAISALFTGIRANVTSYTSGTLIFQVVQ